MENELYRLWYVHTTEHCKRGGGGSAEITRSICQEILSEKNQSSKEHVKYITFCAQKKEI